MSECHCGGIQGLIEWKEFLGMTNIYNRKLNVMETVPLFGTPEALCFVHYRQRLNNMKREEMEFNRKENLK